MEKRRFLDATVDETDAFIRKPSAVRATHFESGRMDTRWTIRDCIPAAIYWFGYCAVLQYPEVLMKSNTESKNGLDIYGQFLKNLAMPDTKEQYSVAAMEHGRHSAL
jgi:hypothetical protein